MATLWLAAALSILLVLLHLLWKYAVRDYWLRPMLLASALSRQGIEGPPRSILLGNLKDMMKFRSQEEDRDLPLDSHDIREHVLPHIFRWSRKYGVPFVFWWAYEPRVIVRDLDILKEVLYNKSGQLWRSPLQQKLLADVVGNGLVVVNTHEWVTSRRIVSPAFQMDKIKGMARTMTCCVSAMLDKWDAVAMEFSSKFDLDVTEHLATLTADVISQTAFGSSYKAGERAFQIIQQMFPLVLKANTSSWNPGLKNKIARLKLEMEATLQSVIDARRALKRSGEITGYGDDLLGLMLDEVEKDGGTFTDKNLMDECKTFFVAGHETTATLLTWTMMLLAVNPEWQERAREEVLELSKGVDPLEADTTNKMKVVGMVLNETLRLYPPAVFVVRYALQDVKLGSLTIPEGVGVHVPVLDILQDPELWGSDCHQFNPERFSGGVANACKNAFAFMPFSHGPRVCVGQAFALMEAKLALAMILRRFSWELSPSYRHNPVLRLSLKPKYGLPLVLRKIYM